MTDSLTLVSDAATLSPLALFLQADFIVRMVMIGLLLASLYSWTVIISHGYSLHRRIRDNIQLEIDFRQKADIVDFYDEHAGKNTLPTARIIEAGIEEWHRSKRSGATNPIAAGERIATAMHSESAFEIDRATREIAVLATIGSVAPFVGLFGTVWGIMRAFTGIAAQNSTSLAVVAPGIAEALFATALGLFAAIPAVIAYNMFAQRLNLYASQMERLIDELHAIFSRQLEGSSKGSTGKSTVPIPRFTKPGPATPSCSNPTGTKQ